MPKLLKNGALCRDTWVYLDAGCSDDVDSSGDVDSSPSGNVLFPLSYWLEHRESLLNRPDSGLWLNSSDELELIAEDITAIPYIAIQFSTFADGRGFSLARLLRERYHYRGELHAAGHVLSDQLYYLKRCGFDSFHTSKDIKSDTALKALSSFTVDYQTVGVPLNP